MNKFLLFFILASLSFYAKAQTVVEFKITQPEELVVEIGNDVTINVGESVTIGSLNSVSGGTPDYYYNWNPDSYLTGQGQLTAEVSPIEDTEYTLYVSDSRGCSATDNIAVTVIPSSSTNNIALEASPGIYPNPATHYFKINNIEGLSRAKVSLLTLTGKIIYSEEVTEAELENKEFKLPTDEGIYLVKLVSGEINKTFQLVVTEK